MTNWHVDGDTAFDLGEHNLSGHLPKETNHLIDLIVDAEPKVDSKVIEESRSALSKIRQYLEIVDLMLHSGRSSSALYRAVG